MNDVEFQNAVSSATQLLAADRSRHRTEANVRSDIVAMLREMNLGTIELEYQTGEGPVDIYLPNRSSFIEVKSYPNARNPNLIQSGRDESIRQQLDRYVHAEIAQEDILRPVNSQSFWTGIITDGRHWHFYEYPHQIKSEPKLIESLSLINESHKLVDSLLTTFGTEKQGKDWIPAEPHALFATFKEELDLLYLELPNKAIDSTETKFQLWLDMMEASGMVPEELPSRKRLFLVHSFLIVVVRLVSHSMADAFDHWHIVLRDGFSSWVLDFARGKDWVDRVYEQIELYDWKKRRTDVFRELYHEFVSEADRKLFGEFYTPDWLAEFMVDEVLDDDWVATSIELAYHERVDGVGVLDPACGSGTFLYHAALRLAYSEHLRDYQYVKRADIICRLLNGIDIHPVAVEIAKVNIERALPANPTEGRSALQVYLGDSLQIHRRDSLFDKEGMMRLSSPRGMSAYIPMELVRHASFDEYIRQMVNAATKGNSLPSNPPYGVDLKNLESCHKQFQEIIEKEGNSVWAWYCSNLAGPRLLEERKVDRIVANPPWVKFSEIQVQERKDAIEEFGKRLGVHMGGNLAPHMDIASFFVLHTRNLYLTDPTSNRGAWLVKVSALRSGHWGKFRELHRRTLRQSVDLTSLQPFGSGDATRCCILFERCHVKSLAERRLVARKLGKKRPDRGESLNSARYKFELELSPDPIPQAKSDYVESEIRQGATIVPHILCRIGEFLTKPDKRGWTSVSTFKNPLAKAPWSALDSQIGKIPSEWARTIYTSTELLAFAVLPNLPQAILPIDEEGDLILNPGERSLFWQRLEEKYEVHKGIGSGTPKTLLSQINFAGKLSAQFGIETRQRRMVLYPGSGDIMRAARVAGGNGFADSKLFWILLRNAHESAYLVAILNAPCLRQAFLESRESGRHFQLHPWRKVPIPRYDGQNRMHRRISELCSLAEGIAEVTVRENLKNNPKLGQVGLSKRIRNAVFDTDVGIEINEIAAKILPDQARSE